MSGFWFNSNPYLFISSFAFSNASCFEIIFFRSSSFTCNSSTKLSIFSGFLNTFSYTTVPAYARPAATPIVRTNVAHIFIILFFPIFSSFLTLDNMAL